MHKNIYVFGKAISWKYLLSFPETLNTTWKLAADV